MAVFSEIYYPGWQAKIDGQPVDIARADYILRVMNVPAGQHTIEMWFDPQSLHVTESIAYASLALLLIGVMILIWFSKKKLTTPKKRRLRTLKLFSDLVLYCTLYTLSGSLHPEESRLCIH